MTCGKYKFEYPGKQMMAAGWSATNSDDRRTRRPRSSLIEYGNTQWRKKASDSFWNHIETIVLYDWHGASKDYDYDIMYALCIMKIEHD